MAKVIAPPTDREIFLPDNVSGWVDNYLPYLESEYRSLDWVAEQWDAWEEDDRIDFVTDWPICVDRLAQLRDWSALGLLSPAQQKRYEALLRTVEAYEPLLTRLLAD